MRSLFLLKTFQSTMWSPRSGLSKEVGSSSMMSVSDFWVSYCNSVCAFDERITIVNLELRMNPFIDQFCLERNGRCPLHRNLKIRRSGFFYRFQVLGFFRQTWTELLMIRFKRSASCNLLLDLAVAGLQATYYKLCVVS